MRLRYKISLILVVVSLAVCFMTYQSYALWVKDMAATQANVIDVGCFHVEYEEQEGTQINLQNTYPVSDTKGLTGKPYTFTITNTCTIDDSYIITLNTKTTDQIEAGEVEVGTDVNGNPIKEPFLAYNMKDKIKFAISSSSSVETEDSNKPTSGTNLGDFSRVEGNINQDKSELTSVTDLAESIIIEKGTLKENQVRTYHVYLWFDGETAGNEIMNQKFEASINVIHRASEPKKVTIAGISIPIVTEGNGLYEVKHPAEETEGMDEGFKQTEYRYAGENYHEKFHPTDYVYNYVTFNEELWRIIGLVNVKTSNETIEQRLKIFKEDKLKDDMFWDSGDGNDWTKASLMKYLNNDYYNTIKNESFKEMIDENIIWNIGGSPTSSILTNEMYVKERGTETYESNPSEWSKNNTEEVTFHSIGLMYPSDLGYAVGGTVETRNHCLTGKALSDYADWGDSECGSEYNWIGGGKVASWLITHDSDNNDNYRRGVYLINGPQYILAISPHELTKYIYPTLYLNQNVKITDGTGKQDDPYVLECAECTV